MYDRENGQRLFRPKIKRKGDEPEVSLGSEVEGPKSINERLYENAQLQRERRQMLQEEAINIQNRAYARPTEKSNQLVDGLQRRKLKQIFRLLDHDSDGMISSQKIDISTISSEVLEAFSSLLIEMEEQDETLDEKSFCEYGLKLFKVPPLPNPRPWTSSKSLKSG
jgi:hypothetical protein